jgi:hypothetical protein
MKKITILISLILISTICIGQIKFPEKTPETLITKKYTAQQSAKMSTLDKIKVIDEYLEKLNNEYTQLIDESEKLNIIKNIESDLLFDSKKYSDLSEFDKKSISDSYEKAKKRLLIVSERRKTISTAQMSLEIQKDNFLKN